MTRQDEALTETEATRCGEEERVRALGRRLRPAVIAIDGPAASGKSTVGYALASALDFLFFDTGMMYRAVTWAALQRRLDVEDSAVMGQLARDIPVDVRAPDDSELDGRHSTVIVGGEDITHAIRSPQVDRSVSPVSAHAPVREALAGHQRRIALRYGKGTADKAGVVMVGRDIGTVVIPEAPLKVYLDATAEERAWRRCKELTERTGQPLDADGYARVLEDINRRDRIDSGRALSPLRAAEDAVTVDTTEMTVAEVVQAILRLLHYVVEGDGRA